MRAVSNTYKQIIASGETRNYVVTINMTLADNTSLTITDADIMDNSFKVFSASSGTDSFDIGAAIIGKCQFTLKNFDDTWTEYDFFDAEATVWVGLVGDINNNTQIYHRLGFFTVDDPQFAGSLISLELLDNMWKFDYDLPSIPLPSSIGDIVNRLCTHCGVILASQSFNGHEITISALPEKKMNCRELLQYLAMLGCNFCVMNDQGALALKWYDTASRPSDNYDGGSFSTSTTPYSDGDNIDGGNFTYYKGKKKYDGGTFTDNSNLGYLTRLFSRNIGTDIITVTGLKIKIGETDYLVGNEGYVLVIENPLITEDNVSSMLSRIWQRLQSFTFRTFDVTVLPDLALEVGDCVAISYKGNMVYSFLTNLTFTPSLTTASLGAVTPTRTLSQRYSKAVETAVEVARQRVDKQIGTYDLMAQRMNQLAINAMGAYTDYDDMPTGGRIYYLSNAPITKNEQGMCEFPETAVVYKTTGDGFFISTGVDPETHVRTWTQGYTPSTGLLVEMLTALRINAEQMYTGKLEVGGSQIGVAKPYIRVLDASDNVVCTIDHRGIIMGSGYIASSDFEDKDPVDVFSLHGMKIDVNGKFIKSPHFGFNEQGAYFDGEVNVKNHPITVRGDIELYTGSGTFQFKPTDYYFAEDFRLSLHTEGSCTVTLVKHENGTDTTVGTYNVTSAADVETALLDHTIGVNENDYYLVTVTGSSCVVSAYDVILAYMGEVGFLGTLRGIFKGYLDSNSGRIAGLRYTSGGYFYGFDAQLINSNGYGNNESRVKLSSGSHGSTDVKPNITRTYTEDGDTKNNSVLWDDANVAYRNEIQYHRNIGVGTGTPEDPSGDLVPADGVTYYKRDANGNVTNIYVAVNGQFMEVRPYIISTYDIGEGQPLPEGSLYLVVDP